MPTRATQPDIEYNINPPPKTLKQCECGATLFQGPFRRGEIRNGDFLPREILWQCVNCNRVQTVEQLHDLAIP